MDGRAAAHGLSRLGRCPASLAEQGDMAVLIALKNRVVQLEARRNLPTGTTWSRTAPRSGSVRPEMAAGADGLLGEYGHGIGGP
jgi:hypothetical protein